MSNFAPRVEPSSGPIPDILDCLSSLSNDEVFTPPRVANRMLDLLPPEIWTNPKIKILDPCTKSGVFLRESAKRLLVGLESAIPDFKERREHVFKKMLYGIATSDLTGLISRRTLYCSKDAHSKFSVVDMGTEDGHIYYKWCPHEFVRGKCTHCGAAETQWTREVGQENYAYPFLHQKEIFPDMNFDVIIGNPPYQMGDGGFGASASPIYHLFVEKAKEMDPTFLSMIIPSRWFTGGKGLDRFRAEMIDDRNLRVLVDNPGLFDVFPGVEIKGGVCYFVRDMRSQGDCRFRTELKGDLISEESRDLREGVGVLVRSNEAVPILEKVRKRAFPSFSSRVSTQKPFGLRTFVVGSEKRSATDDTLLYRRGGIGYVPRSTVTVNVDWVDRYKVFTPRAGDGHGRVPMRVTGEPIVAGPGSACSETYLVASVCESESEASFIAAFLRSKFARLLISLRKTTQQVSSEVFAFVPDVGFSQSWTDERLYDMFDLTQEERAFVEATIREMA